MSQNQPIKKKNASNKYKTGKKSNSNGMKNNNQSFDKMKSWANKNNSKDRGEEVNANKIGNKTQNKNETLANKQNKNKGNLPNTISNVKRQASKQVQKINASSKKMMQSNMQKKKNPQIQTSHEPVSLFKNNYLFYVSVAVIVIPCVLLAYIFLSSQGNSNEPVEGNRFKGDLEPAIPQEQVSALQNELALEGVDKIEVNLKSATLRVLVDVKDDATLKQMQKIQNQIYEKITAKFPVDVYFTNKKKDDNIAKMYDLEIDVYNFIPENEEQKSKQIHINKIKNSSSEEAIEQVLTTAKDKETSDLLLHPDLSNPPVNESEE